LITRSSLFLRKPFASIINKLKLKLSLIIFYHSLLRQYAGGDGIVVQFDGKGGVNALWDAKNLKYHINGLENIKVPDCGATFSIYPENQEIDLAPSANGIL